MKFRDFFFPPLERDPGQPTAYLKSRAFISAVCVTELVWNTDNSFKSNCTVGSEPTATRPSTGSYRKGAANGRQRNSREREMCAQGSFGLALNTTQSKREKQKQVKDI